MSFFCKNAQEEALKNIAWQMKVDNSIKLASQLREVGEISEEQYVEILKELFSKV